MSMLPTASLPAASQLGCESVPLPSLTQKLLGYEDGCGQSSAPPADERNGDVEELVRGGRRLEPKGQEVECCWSPSYKTGQQV